MNIDEVKKNAPEGATDYKIKDKKVIYYKRTRSFWDRLFGWKGELHLIWHKNKWQRFIFTSHPLDLIFNPIRPL